MATDDLAQSCGAAVAAEAAAGSSQDSSAKSLHLSEPPDGLPILDDGGLAGELSRLAGSEDEVLVVANAFTAYVAHRADARSPWQPVCCGEFGSEALQAAKPLTRARLRWAAMAGAPWEADLSTVPTVKGTSALLSKWLKEAGIVTQGREGDVTPAIKEQLYYLAGWRCQFFGCGLDLRRHTATGSVGRFSYFAHIVAASPDGPRGDPVLSKRLASESSNFLLLCDQCHRLIDKINPAKYTVAILRKMREDSIAEVRRLLDTLRHEEAEVIAILGNIAGQPAQFSMGDAHEALWAAGLRSQAAKPARYFDPGGQHHEVHSADYWGSLFRQLRMDLQQLQTLLNGTRSGAARPRLAVFPLHGTSVLLLAGRVLGDTEGVHLFQPHRNKVGQETRWAWPERQEMQPLDKFKLEVVRAAQEADTSAVLVVALTSDVAASRAPSICARDGEWLLPTLRISGPALDKDCIQRPEDLQLVGLAVDAAMRKLQDEWRIDRVYLFVSAPASAVVVVGQKMQARHHAQYICHESAAGPGGAYLATIELTSHAVRELVSPLNQTLSLQP